MSPPKPPTLRLTEGKGQQRDAHDWGGDIDKRVWQDWSDPQENDVIEQLPPPPLHLPRVLLQALRPEGARQRLAHHPRHAVAAAGARGADRRHPEAAVRDAVQPPRQQAQHDGARDGKGLHEQVGAAVADGNSGGGGGGVGQQDVALCRQRGQRAWREVLEDC